MNSKTLLLSILALLAAAAPARGSESEPERSDSVLFLEFGSGMSEGPISGAPTRGKVLLAAFLWTPLKSRDWLVLRFAGGARSDLDALAGNFSAVLAAGPAVRARVKPFYLTIQPAGIAWFSSPPLFTDSFGTLRVKGTRLQIETRVSLGIEAEQVTAGLTYSHYSSGGRGEIEAAQGQNYVGFEIGWRWK